MTDAQLKQLDELMEKGFTTKNVSVLDGLLKATIRTSTAKDQLEVESSLKVSETIPLHMIHNYSTKLLSRVLLSVTYKDKTQVFKDFMESEAFLVSRPNFVIDLLLKEHSELEKEIRAFTTPENLEQNFSTAPSTEPASK